MLKKCLALFLAILMTTGMLAGCQPANNGGSTPGNTNPSNGGSSVTPYVPTQAECTPTTSVKPSNWNEFTYADNNDTQIMSYIGSSFYGYDYKFENDQKFNEDGSINKDGIVPGAYTVNYSAATKLEDVTSTVDAKWGYTDDQKAEGGYAWKITLRDDLKWDDGTPIKAEDFEYSMKELLNPLFLNFRSNTYYESVRIINSKTYLYNGLEGYDAADSLLAEYDPAMDEKVIWKMNSSSVSDPVTGTGMSSLRAAYNTGYEDYGMTAESTAGEYLVALSAAFGAPVEVTADQINALEGKTFAAIKADATLKATFDYLVAWWGEGDLGSYAFGVTYFKNDTFDWENVGCYAIPEENAIVVCLEAPFQMLTDDGDLSVWSAYYLSSLPLVKKDLYESCKIAPANGATLWTSNYNSSLATTASWGPYKLVEFEAGSHYKLVKNPNWYGWSLEENKNQYNITAINCRKVEEASTKWMGFLAGNYDDAALDTENVDEYLDSKYVYYTSTSTGTFGMQLYSDLETLKVSDNNNGILAIQEFRHALNLGLNRSDVVEQIWPGSAVPCFGLLNVAYYYDIENSPELEDGGQYRNTAIAKAGILRAYGYTQAADGTWGTGDLSGLTLDEAYETLTGYNPTVAKEKMNAAIKELTENADKYGYDPTKNITLVYGSSVDSDKQRFRCEYLQGVIDGLTEGTALEDKIDVVFDASAGNQWAEAFRTGKTQIGFGYGFSGNAFNPFNIVGAFVNPDDDLNYHMYWDTSAIDMTLTLPAGDYEGAGETITMSVQNWFFCLNGLAEAEGQKETYNWSAGYAPAEARLTILSALEELTIKESRSVMLIADGGGSFLGAKFKYLSDEEHTFMGFGGIRYMEVVYTDAEWAEYVAANNNDLSSEYKKSE